MKKSIIACKVFEDELFAVLPDAYKDIEITLLDAGLHWDLEKLEKTLNRVAAETTQKEAEPRFMFGAGCHPDMCDIVNKHDAKSLGVKNCVEAFCHEDIYELEQNRTMVITPGWIRCSKGMMTAAGYDEVDIRRNFGFYDRFLLMDTGVNPLTDEEILEFYDLTQVLVEIQPVSLDYFRANLMELLR